MAKSRISVSSLKAKYGIQDTEYLPTGNVSLDHLWNGGLPTGKIVEIHSLPGIGKSTVVLQLCKHIIKKKNLKVAYVDVENALDKPLKDGVGISCYETVGDNGDVATDANSPLFLQLNPNTFSEVEETFDYLLDNGYKIIVLDSITNIVPDRRMEGSITDEQPGLKSKLQAVLLERYKGELARKGVTLIIINQMRTSINFLNTTVEPAGGKALAFNTDIRTTLKKKDYITENGDKGGKKIGVVIEATTIKNKLALPFATALMYLYFGTGVDIVQTIGEMLILKGKFIQAGSYFKTPDGNNVQGKKGVFTWIRENPDKIKALLSDTLGFADRSNEASEEDEAIRIMKEASVSN